MQIDTETAAVLSQTRVVEFTTLTREGAPSTRPMSALWRPESHEIVLTTPLAYPQKAFNVRREPRVALLFSDPTGSGLTDPPGVLVQGHATAPDVVAGPDDVHDFWREMFTRHPAAARLLSDPSHQQTMDWYYWRLVITVTPGNVHRFPAVAVGGDAERPGPGQGAGLADRVADALTRYPTAVLGGRDATGAPYAVRASVRHGSAGTLLVDPVATGSVEPGAASLLWQRHDGAGGAMDSLLVLGTLTPDLAFVPDRIPGSLELASAAGDIEWHDQGRHASLRYLERRRADPPVIDWSDFARWAQR